jgi:hypothetical protein
MDILIPLQNPCASDKGSLEQASELMAANVLQNRARRARSVDVPIGLDSGREGSSRSIKRTFVRRVLAAFALQSLRYCSCL